MLQLREGAREGDNSVGGGIGDRALPGSIGGGGLHEHRQGASSSLEWRFGGTLRSHL